MASTRLHYVAVLCVALATLGTGCTSMQECRACCCGDSKGPKTLLKWESKEDKDEKKDDKDKDKKPEDKDEKNEKDRDKKSGDSKEKDEPKKPESEEKEKGRRKVETPRH